MALAYITVKTAIKQKVTGQTFGGALFSRNKTKTAVPTITPATGTTSTKPSFMQRQKDRWHNPNSLRRQIANQALATGATVAAAQLVPGAVGVDPNLQMQQLQGTITNGINTGIQNGVQTIQSIPVVQQGTQLIQAVPQAVQNGIQTIPQTVNTN